jgi:hypothetical protein
MQKPFLILSWLLILAACTERMDITTDNATPRLVITGYITTDPMPHIISISQTIGYFGPNNIKTHSDATVKINNELLMPVGNGQYVTNPSFYGVPGKEYVLDVELDYDENGIPEHYTATTTMPPMHELDSVSLAPVMRSEPSADPLLFIMVHFQDVKNVENTFGVHFYINGEKYSNRIQRYFLNNFGDRAADGDYIHFPLIPGYLLRKEMTWDNKETKYLYTGDILTVELNMLEKNYFEFIRTAILEINGGVPLFAGPPANIPGNISGGALGIFGAYTASRKSIRIDEKYGFPSP